MLSDVMNQLSQQPHTCNLWKSGFVQSTFSIGCTALQSGLRYSLITCRKDRKVDKSDIEVGGGGCLMYVFKNAAGWYENSSNITEEWSDGPFFSHCNNGKKTTAGYPRK